MASGAPQTGAILASHDHLEQVDHPNVFI